MLTAKELAQKLRVTKTTVYKWIKKGELKAEKRLVNHSPTWCIDDTSASEYIQKVNVLQNNTNQEKV